LLIRHNTLLQTAFSAIFPTGLVYFHLINKGCWLENKIEIPPAGYIN